MNHRKLKVKFGQSLCVGQLVIVLLVLLLDRCEALSHKGVRVAVYLVVFSGRPAWDVRGSVR